MDEQLETIKKMLQDIEETVRISNNMKRVDGELYIENNGLKVDVTKQLLIVENKLEKYTVRLTKNECTAMCELIKSEDGFCTYEQLIMAVYGMEMDDSLLKRIKGVAIQNQVQDRRINSNKEPKESRIFP